MYLIQKYLFPILGAFSIALIFYVPEIRILVFVVPLFFIVFLKREAKTAIDASLGVWLGFFLAALAIFWSLRLDGDAWNYLGQVITPQALRWLPAVFFVSWILASVWVATPYALFGFLFWRFKRDNFGDTFLAAGFWGLAEFLRAKMFFGFTWGHLGYWLFDAIPSLGVSARFWGVAGLSFITVILAGVAAFLIFDLPQAKKKAFPLYLAVGLIASVISIGLWGQRISKQEREIWQKASRPAFSLQAYLPWGVRPEMKEVASGFWVPRSYAALLEQINPSPGAIIILPEEILPPIDLGESLYQWTQEERGLETLRRKLGASFIMFGQPIRTGGKTFNTFVISDGSPETKLYIKNRLFPFVEYLPFGESFVRKAFPFVPDFFSRRERVEPGETKIGTIGVFSCLELLLPDFVRNQVNQGASILVSGGSEIAWGKYVWEQDLLVSRFQAAAYKRFLIRAMKQGYSVIANPLGEVLAVSNGQDDALLQAKVELISEKTFITKIGETGATLIFLTLAGLIIVLRKTKLEKP